LGRYCLACVKANLQLIADEHNRRGTRSAHRLVAELQAPLVERLHRLLAAAEGPFTRHTLMSAIMRIEECE
jgi:hypothetical protein